MGDGWINTVEIVVIKIDKEGAFTKRYNGRCNNDGIHHPSKAFIKHPQVLGSLWRAVQGRQTWSLFMQELAIVFFLCQEHNVPTCHWCLKDTPCHYLRCLSFWFSRVGGKSFLSFLLIMPHTVVFHPPGRHCLCQWVSLQVGTALMFIHSIRRKMGGLWEVIVLLLIEPTGLCLSLRCNPCSHRFCPPWSRLWASWGNGGRPEHSAPGWQCHLTRDQWFVDWLRRQKNSTKQWKVSGRSYQMFVLLDSWRILPCTRGHTGTC